MILESLACGTPAIATRESGGIQEIADQCQQSQVTIIDEFENFVPAMMTVSKKEKSDSLLPPLYTLDNISASFKALILRGLG